MNCYIHLEESKVLFQYPEEWILIDTHTMLYERIKKFFANKDWRSCSFDLVNILLKTNNIDYDKTSRKIERLHEKCS